MLNITGIRSEARPQLNFEIEDMITIPRREYAELLEKADRAEAILRLALEKQREFRRGVANMDPERKEMAI